MLQLAYGGYTVVTGSEESEDIFVDDPIYQEPGFNIMQPIVIHASSEADRIHILLREREDNKGDKFKRLDDNDFSIEIFDETTENFITDYITMPVVHTIEEWYDSNFDSLNINFAPVVDDDNIRVCHLTITKKSTNEFITARIIVDFDSQPMGFMVLNHDLLHRRPRLSSFGRSIVVNISKSGNTVILSPYSTFSETNEDEFDFSMLGKDIYYSLSNTANFEGYKFSINNESIKDMMTAAHVYPDPVKKEVAFLMIDSFMKKIINSVSRSAYLDILATGVESGTQHTFRIYFSKNN